MKQTALYNKHIALGAKMVPFAGYEMPVSYSGIKDEHQAVRSAAGLFDVSHMGEFEVSGKEAKQLVQYVTSNDVNKLEPGKIQYSCLPNENGGIVDDLLVYMLDEGKYMLVVNASNIDKDFEWINKYTYKFDANIKDVSEDFSLLAIQGPRATDILQKLAEIELSSIPYYNFRVGTIAGVENVIISATGYTGSGGFEIYCHIEDAEKIWDAIMKEGQPMGLKPAGLGCRDTLRLEMGYCLYGNDINEKTSPLAAGLGWITKFNKDFVGKGVLEEKKEKGTQYKLVGIEVFEKGAIPRQHYEIYNTDEELIGEITSGTQSPSLNKPIAMGYVKKEFSKAGTELFIKIRHKMARASVVSLPFYTNTRT